jgi:3-methyladenine DNA glycosylase Tag
LSLFRAIEARAAERKGGAAPLAKLLPRPRTRAALAETPDEFFLSALAKQVFRAGFVWQIVEYKWPAMEEAFAGFRPEVVAGLEDSDIEDLLADPLAIRHRAKLRRVRENASWMLRVSANHGSFGRFLADWPSSDVVGLWATCGAKAAGCAA